MPHAFSHSAVRLCAGRPWGLAVGFVAPLLRSVLFGMPPMFPIAVSMAFELAAYGLVSGLVWRRVKHTLPMMYAALVTAMVAGRLVWGAVRFVLAGLTGGSFPFQAFLSGALLTAVPGILAQLVLIPLILTALQKAKVYGLRPFRESASAIISVVIHIGHRTVRKCRYPAIICGQFGICPHSVQLPIDSLVSLLNAVQGMIALVQAFIKALIDLLQLSQFSYCLL